MRTSNGSFTDLGPGGGDEASSSSVGVMGVTEERHEEGVVHQGVTPPPVVDVAGVRKRLTKLALAFSCSRRGRSCWRWDVLGGSG